MAARNRDSLPSLQSLGTCSVAERAIRIAIRVLEVSRGRAPDAVGPDDLPAFDAPKVWVGLTGSARLVSKIHRLVNING